MNSAENINIGDYIEIKENLSEDEEKSFYNDKLKVVGIIKSPLYISRDRGTTTLGSGKIAYYMYVDKSNINSDIYTEIDITVKDAKSLSSLNDNYKNKIKDFENELEDIKEERQNARHQELIDEATNKLNESQTEFENSKKEAEDKIKEAEKKIEDGKNEIAKSEKKLKDGENKLKEGKDKANTEFANAEAQIAEGKTKLIKAQEELNNGITELNQKKSEAESGIAQIKSGIEKIDQTISTLETQKQTLEKALGNLNEINKNIDSINEMISYYESQLNQNTENKDEIENKIKELKQNLETLKNTKQQLESSGVSEEALNQIVSGISECNVKKKELNNQLNDINNQLSSAQAQIDNGQNEINKGWENLNNSISQLENSKNETEKKLASSEKEIENGKKQIEKAKKELEDGEKELQENKEKFNTEITDAENKLIEAREKVNDIENAKWYIFDRDDNSGFNSFSQDTDNIEKLGKLFPIVFFVIATLISLTSMSRMVEEERVQIGTLKALGYNRIQIMQKYIIYSLLASLIGGLLGATFGLKFFPTVIISMYQMMYDISDITIEFNKYYAFLGIGIMSLCIVGATIVTAIKELSSTPSELMRPKAPKIGKRVLLEKIPFIWKRLNFTQKVTIRNMFRYKKRFLMTVVGICGCTALILTGFGLKDSISKIMDYQYIDIYNYDMLISLKDTLTSNEKQDLINDLESKDEIEKCVPIYITSETLKNGDLSEDAQIMVTLNPNEFDYVVKLKDLKTGEKLELNDDEIIITDKLAQLINAKKGDEIYLVDSENNEYKVKVGAVTEHYISHYVYMTNNLYNKIFGENANENVLFAQYSQSLDEQKENELSKTILENSKVSAVTLTSYLMETINNTLSAMNLVVYVLIISAGLLAFIVLYNLANVNISERIRELATIKVLGFYDKEVYDYVTREIMLLTIIGICLGLVFGYILNSFILGTCEIGILRFKKIITIPSYVYASLITVIFTTIVNFITFFSLKKIDMIESLKSVE